MANDFRTEVMAAALNDSGAIKTLSLELFDARENLKSKQDALNARRAGLFSKVCQQIDKETKKAVFTNEAGRNAETDRLFAEDSIAGSLRQQAAKLEREIYVKQLDLDALNRGIGIRKAFLHGGD